jgi:hypothetical protein
MIFDYTVAGKVQVTMEGFIDELSQTYDVNGKASTPAMPNLFNIDSGSALLSLYQAKRFHSCVAKCLYLGKRVKPDILVCVSFLTSRVLSPTIEDLSKLVRLLKYINLTRSFVIVLEPGADASINSFIDASYAVHPDMKSHSGVVISIGKGPIYAKSSQINLNVKSSTEAEVVAASDGCSKVIWCREFLLEQGEPIGAAILHQDNKSAMQLLEHESKSSGRSRYVNIRYFWLRDRVALKEVHIVYIATESMIADILTKPLQGEQFGKLRSELLNWCSEL